MDAAELPVVLFRKILPLVRAAGLVAADGSHQHRFGQLHHVAELDELGQVGVVFAALVGDPHEGQLLLHLPDHRKDPFESHLVAEDADVAVEDLAQEVPLFVEVDLVREAGNRRHEVSVLFELSARCGRDLPVSAGEGRGVLSRFPAEDDGLEQRVAPQTVGAVDFGVGALAAGEEPLHLRHVVAVHVDAPHRVVGHGLDRDEVADRIDPLVEPGQLALLGQILLDEGLPQMADIQKDLLALFELLPDRFGDLVAGEEFVDEVLPSAVDDPAARAPGALADQDAAGPQRRGVKLHVLQVAQHASGPHRRRQTVSGGRRGVGREASVEAGVSAAGHDDAFRADRLHLAASHLDRRDARHPVLLDDEVEQVVLVVKPDTGFECRIVEGVEDLQSRVVLGVAGPLAAGASQPSLRHLSVPETAEGGAQAVEPRDRLGRLLAQTAHHLFVGQRMGRFHRVGDMGLHTVGFDIAQGGVDTTLCHRCLGTGRTHFAQHRHLRARFMGRQRRAESGPAASYDQNIHHSRFLHKFLGL